MYLQSAAGSCPEGFVRVGSMVWHEEISFVSDRIGEGSRVEGAIVDKNVRIGRNVNIRNEAGVQNGDLPSGVVIRDGVVVVPKDATLEDGWEM